MIDGDKSLRSCLTSSRSLLVCGLNPWFPTWCSSPALRGADDKNTKGTTLVNLVTFVTLRLRKWSKEQKRTFLDIVTQLSGRFCPI